MKYYCKKCGQTVDSLSCFVTLFGFTFHWVCFVRLMKGDEMFGDDVKILAKKMGVAA